MDTGAVLNSGGCANDMATRVVLSFEGRILGETELAKTVTVVGRHPDCDIVIDNPAVSGRHMLFRKVNRTVYAEDLASTNGTIVNGVPIGHQVVHHLDQIEIGRHRLHFFDDALLSSAVSDLEHTVVTEYERTMMAGFAGEARAQAAPVAQASAAPDPQLSRTLAIPREALVDTLPGTGAARHAAGVSPYALRVLDGERAGELIGLDRANTMIGTAGSDTALVIRRGSAVYVARLSGPRSLNLNGNELGAGTHALAAGDVIDVGDSRFEVVPAAP